MPVEAPLSNGQLFSWREAERYPVDWLQDLNMPTTWDLRGRTIAQVNDALGRLVDRHEVLRTTYHSGNGRPIQRVHDAIELPIERSDHVITDPMEHEQTKAELAARPFGMSDDLNWRGRLVSMHGDPVYLSLIFSHLIVDMWSIHHLQDQFKALVADPAAEFPVGNTPRELAAGQRADSWRARQESSERYWRQVLDEGLMDSLPTLPSRVKRGRLELTLRSHRLTSLAAQAARQLGVTAPALVKSFIAAGLARHLDTGQVTMSMMSSNRFAQEDQHNIGTMNQLIPFVSTVGPDATIAEHVRHLHWAATRAYRYSCYDLDRVTAMAAAHGEDPGHGCWVNHLFRAWFNYMQLDRRAPEEGKRGPAELTWSPVAQPYGQPFRVRVEVRGGRTTVLMLADPDVLPAEAMVDMMRMLVQGVRLALRDPDRRLKELWKHDPADLPPSLFPTG